MKKLKILLIVFTVFVTLTGCSLGEPSIKLTEEESNAIAQYCAHLIMKYGAKNIYNEKLLDRKDFEDAVKEKEAKLNPTPTPTPKVTEPPVVTEEPPEGNKGEGNTGDDQGNKPPENTPIPTPSGVIKDASALFDPSVFEVSVKDFLYTRNFKSDLEYFTLSAPSGKMIAIFTIDVKNISSQTKVFDYNNYSAQFQLVADEKSAVSPEISLLSNDFRFTRSEIKAGESFSGVVVFFVKDDTKKLTFRILGETQAYELNYTAEVENGN